MSLSFDAWAYEAIIHHHISNYPVSMCGLNPHFAHTTIAEIIFQKAF